MQILEQYIPFNDQQIYTKQWIVDESFTTAPIILLHESLGSTELWKDFPQVLAEKLNRNIISYDRLGFGKSSQRNDVLGLHFISDEIHPFKAILSTLNINDFILIGHSVGGGMAVAIASMMPEQCKAVVTLAAQAYVENETLAGIQHASDHVCSDPRFLESMSRYHGERTQWVLDAWTKTWLNPAFKGWNVEPFLTQLDCLLLVLHGDSDQYATLEQPQYFIEKAKTSRKILRIFRECGHFPHREKLDNVMQTLEIFLKPVK